MIKPWPARPFTLALLVFAALGCSTQMVRSALYAPEFIYREDVEIKSTMHRFAADISSIRAHLDADADADGRAKIPALLADMEDAAAELAATGEASNHPIFDRYLDDLRRDLAHARTAATRTPPDYLPAATLTGSCIACHRVRR